MKKILILLFSTLISFNSYGASDEPTRYVYGEFNIDNASKYTISTGDMHEFSCALTQIIFSQEALTAMKNNKKFDFMNSEFTPTSIDLYKNKVYWVDLDLNTKIKNNFVKFKPISGEEQLFELIHKDDELIFRMKTPHKGSTLVCDFPFRELGIEIKYSYGSKGQKLMGSIYKDGKGVGLITYQYYENGQINSEQNYKDGKWDGKFTEWYENGKKKSEHNWKDNIPDGDWTSWFENGQIGSEGSFKDGTGTFLQLHENGQKSYEVIFKDGLGKRTRWHENGRIKFEGNYKDGKENGKVTEWDESGQIKSEKNYKDGECISGDC